MATKKFHGYKFPYTEEELTKLAGESKGKITPAKLTEAQTKIKKAVDKEYKAFKKMKTEVAEAKEAYGDALKEDEHLKELTEEEDFWTMVFPYLAMGDDEGKVGFLKSAKEYKEGLAKKKEMELITPEKAEKLEALLDIYEKADEKAVEDFNEKLEAALKKVREYKESLVKLDDAVAKEAKDIEGAEVLSMPA